MKLKRFYNYINEQVDNPSYEDVKADLRDLIEKSLKSSDKKTIDEFIAAYSRDDEKNQIEGLINDSDIYEFYLKYKNSVDEILSEKDFFEKKPSEIDSFSLYDFVVSGTKVAIKELVNSIS